MAYKVSTLKKRPGTVKRVLLGEGEKVFACVENLQDLEELSKLLPPRCCVVELGRAFHRWAARGGGEATRFIELLSQYQVSPNTSVKNKVALHNLLVATLSEGTRIKAKEGLLKSLLKSLDRASLTRALESLM